MKNFLTSLLFVVILGACQSQVKTTDGKSDNSLDNNDFPKSDFPTISEEYVGGLVATLADDNMLGRKSGTEGERLASEFIAKQFEEIGLTFYEGMESYYQPFEVSEVRNQTVKAKLNGKLVEEGKVFVVASIEEINLKNPKDVVLENVSNLGELRDVMEKLNSAKNTVVILVNPSLETEFSSLRNRLSEQTFSSDSNKNTAIWILSEEEKLNGIELNFKQEIEKKTFRNVVGVLKGKSNQKESIVFSAHYDHLGTLEAVKNDSIANGADDDASGVSAIISLAKHFRTTQSNQRTLVFVAFTAEELGLYGSSYFVNSLNLNPTEIIANINIEMIGKQSEFGSGKPFMTGFEKSDLQKIMNKSLGKSSAEIIADPYKKFGLFYRSDNASFVKNGIVAHTISTCKIDTDIYYHTVDDELETLNIPQMTRTIQVLAKAIEPLISGASTPKWTGER